jgi:alanyl-tRNA synthetase
MNSHEIRRKFLDFFKSKGHQIVSSAPLVVKNDPTLMFTNSGMAQFKDFFLGNKTPEFRRVADTQKCLRVSGKHNDLEDVGLDTYHHTMFEMLGNWSFGDYFKKDALEWSWELLTGVYGLPKDRLYVTVFGGDEKEKLDADGEAFQIWKTMVPESQILYGSKKDNFWEMGDTGPCGPCSEIHIDLRPEADVQREPGRDWVNRDHPQVVEIWNNVFMQFERLANGSLVPLPSRHVDTGMGFERLCMAIQGVTSNYDTDVFQPLIRTIGQMGGKAYGQDNRTDIAMRVIADHIRAISFTIADGQLPSNVRAGYVIRRILRRAVRYGYTYLNFREPFLYRLVPQLADQFADVFPELKAQEDFVSKVVREEEASFLRTLELGLKRINSIIDSITTAFSFDDVPEGDDSRLNFQHAQLLEKSIVSGKEAFELYDTYGFPLDLTALIARERGFRVDEVGFQQEMAAQKERSRADAASEATDWTEVYDADAVEFLGYDQLEAEARIVKYRAVTTKDKTQYQVVLDQTPFYAESGGQVGDRGVFVWNAGQPDQKVVRITDTKKENDLIIHFTGENVGQLGSLLNQPLTAKVETGKRLLTENNHSATHLLHAALKEVLGNHVAQKGSLVNENVLRFDFSHFVKLADEEIERVEKIVNRKIRENIARDEKRNVPIAKAMELGATALFGEKYGDFVRVITFDPHYSIELCGGTHVPATGQIGLFKIVSESAVAAGVRRIEAVTADKAEELVDEQFNTLRDLRELLKGPKDVKKAVADLLGEKNALARQLEAYQVQQAGAIRESLLQKVRRGNGVSVIAEKVTLPSADALKQIAFELKGQVENLFLVLAADVQGKPQVAVMIGENLVKEKNLHAGNIVKELAREIKGGGGGQPFFATAGGTDLSGLDRVVEKGSRLLG